jgi:5-methylcytosine-specific restriction endonuclease McrA
MKICSRCKVSKPESDFFMRDKKTGRRHAECKTCYTERRKDFYHEHYQRYGDLYRQRAKARREKVRAELQTNLLQYLSDKRCVKCGENDPVVLEFDHLLPAEKSFGIARAISNGMKWPMILGEIKKCQILCANCHKRKTAQEFNWYHRVK